MLRQGTETHVPEIFPLQPDEFQTGELRDQRRSTFNYPTAATRLLSLLGGPKSQHTHSLGTDVPKCMYWALGVIQSLPERVQG